IVIAMKAVNLDCTTSLRNSNDLGLPPRAPCGRVGNSVRNDTSSHEVLPSNVESRSMISFLSKRDHSSRARNQQSCLRRRLANARFRLGESANHCQNHAVAFKHAYLKPLQLCRQRARVLLQDPCLVEQCVKRGPRGIKLSTRSQQLSQRNI